MKNYEKPALTVVGVIQKEGVASLWDTVTGVIPGILYSAGDNVTGYPWGSGQPLN